MNYADLASLRHTADWGYAHPENYGYDFRDWVSPYTKSCHCHDGFMLVLQDWASHDYLVKGVDPTVQELGRDPNIQTNVRLSRLVEKYLDLQLEDCYVTNLFPFIKPGHMSAAIPVRDLQRAGEQFLAEEVRLCRPSVILALGGQVSSILAAIAIDHHALPHPAARISNARMEQAWSRR